jgi:hypothetical protein
LVGAGVLAAVIVGGTLSILITLLAFAPTLPARSTLQYSRVCVPRLSKSKMPV